MSWRKLLPSFVIPPDPTVTKLLEPLAEIDDRGVYFEDPDGHLLEIITRPYGSGGA